MVWITATKVYKDAGQRSTWNKKGKQKKLSCFETSLCIVLLKVKVQHDPVPSDNGRKKSSTNSSIVSTTRKMGKQSPPFNLYAPLVTSVKKPQAMSEVVKATGAQKGKSLVKFVYYLEPFISKPALDDDCSNSDVSALLLFKCNHKLISLFSSFVEKHAMKDKTFTSFFTLSTFRKDMMVTAVDNYASEYAITKRVLGPHCKVYCQKHLNSNTWMELSET